MKHLLMASTQDNRKSSKNLNIKDNQFLLETELGDTDEKRQSLPFASTVGKSLYFEENL